MLTNQRHLFNLDDDHIYLNGAYMSPQLKSVSEVGIEGLKKKETPYGISGEHFFSIRKELRETFSTLIGLSDYNQTAIIPAVSYGIANAVNNIKFEKGDEVLVVDEQFPSHIYAWQGLASRNGGSMKTIASPEIAEGRGAKWNEAILAGINAKTAVVALPHVHWADGTKYDLVKIKEKANQVGAKLIIDATQSLGALSFLIDEIKPDVMVAGGYKWLLGPYALGMAYYSEAFNDGQPIEQNWINRYKSEDFSQLTNYQNKYQAGAERYTMGESSNFILAPMLTKSIQQLIDWGQDNIQDYCKSITADGVDILRSKGCFIEADEYRGQHLFGVYLPNHLDKEKIKQRLTDEKISVSYRGSAIRVSPNVYNTKDEFLRFVDCVK